MKGLEKKKEIVARMLGCSKKKVRFGREHLSEIKDAVTKADLRSLIKKGYIKIVGDKGVSRARARKRREQKKKGRRRGHGSRKGKAGARIGKKEVWVTHVRAQRKALKQLREKGKIKENAFRDVYRKIGGGAFRSVRHMLLYIEEHGLLKK